VEGERYGARYVLLARSGLGGAEGLGKGLGVDSEAYRNIIPLSKNHVLVNFVA
jgi:hypothetical protein